MQDETHKNGMIFAPEPTTTRVHTVSTKLNANELSEFNSLAQLREVAPGELLRVLVKEEQERLKAPAKASVELVELVGLRLMLNNFLRPLAQGKIQTADEVKALSDSIRERKAGLAQELVDGAKE